MDGSLARIWDDAAAVRVSEGPGSPCSRPARDASGLGARRDGSPCRVSTGGSVADENARNGASGAGKLRLLDIYLRAKREGRFE